MKTKIFYIGVDGEVVVNGMETENQIGEVLELECDLLDPDDQKKLTWKEFYNEADNCLFMHILLDRKKRVDSDAIMADRPSFCVITAIDNKAVRLEYYEGHDALRLKYDIRSIKLQGVKLTNFMDHDSNGYDPSKFLEETFGIPKDFSKPILDEVHKKLNQE